MLLLLAFRFSLSFPFSSHSCELSTSSHRFFPFSSQLARSAKTKTRLLLFIAMPYLNRRTVRSLLARSRPAPSPVSTRPAETLTDTVKPEPRATLPSSSSAPVGLVETSPSVLSSARAVTANESISPASARSMPANTTNNRASTSTPGESHSSEHTQPLVDAAQHEIAAYLEAGIPIPGAVPAAPPVFAPYVAGHVPASDSPPYEFNGLFAVPTASTSPPATPGAPPLYQPHASDAEVFPQLPFTPFHRNAIVARSGGERVEHELPGDVSLINRLLYNSSTNTSRIAFLAILAPAPSTAPGSAGTSPP